MTTHTRLRQILFLVWLVGVGVALYLVIFHRDVIVERLRVATAASMVGGGALYLALGCLRGFTLIPMTSLLLVGMLFFPPWPLFLLTLAGALVSSVSIYFFAEALHLDELLQRKHADQIDRLRDLLNKYGLPVIIGWTFFPLTPTDLISYLSGVLRINLFTFIAGIAIGKAGILAIYVFVGDWLL